MITASDHLLTDQRDQLMELFSDFAPLFDGILGCVPEVEFELQLKPNAKPCCAWAYKIPQSIYSICCSEIQELCNIAVLEKDVYSKWGAPCLFRPKKNGGVRFITDLRQLNKCLKRTPFPLPLINEVIWQIQGIHLRYLSRLQQRILPLQTQPTKPTTLWPHSTLGKICLQPFTTRLCGVK